MKATILTFAVIVCIAAPACAAATATEEHAAPDTEIVSEQDVKELAARYYQQGAEAYLAGTLKLARSRLRAALKLDRENAKAKVLLEVVEKKLGITDRIRTEEKLRERIPRVEFQDAALKEVVDYLAREADVNIVFDGSALQLLAAEEAAPPEAAWPEEEAVFDADDELPPLAPPKGTVRPAPVRRDLITIRLKNVPLKEVLKYVLRFKGLKYIVEDYAILIVRIDWAGGGDLITEVFHLTMSGAGPQTIRPRSGDETGLWGPGGY